jgi:hypothetical protein
MSSISDRIHALSNNQIKKRRKIEYNNSMINVHHLGKNRMLPNTFNCKHITKSKASQLMKTYSVNRPTPYFLYDSNYDGFNIDGWQHVVKKDDAPKYYILQQEDKSVLGKGSMVYTGRVEGNNLQSIFDATKLSSEYLTKVCTETGLGEMSAYTVNNKFGQQTQAAMHAKTSIKQQIKSKFFTILGKCKKIFNEQFGGKHVGYEQLQQQLREVFVDCNNAPMCYITSKNLSNSEHLDTKDYSRSYAFWVTEHDYEGAYLLFPQWGLAIELCHGRYISWNGKECAHCTSVPNKSDIGVPTDIYSLFTALPKDIYNESVKKAKFDKVIETRHTGGVEMCNTFFESLRVGMTVQYKVLPPSKVKYLNDKSTTNNKRKKITKQYHYYQRNKIMKIMGDRIIILKRDFEEGNWILTKQQVCNRLAIDT